MVEVNDICLHSFSWDIRNKAQCIVKVKSILSKDVAEIEVLRVTHDDSCNKAFTYLCNAKKSINVSIKSLKKLKPAGYDFIIER